jgi:hypothetical protein
MAEVGGQTTPSTPIVSAVIVAGTRPCGGRALGLVTRPDAVVSTNPEGMSLNSKPAEAKKPKAPDHSIRVGTDSVRLDGRARRASRLHAQLEERRAAAQALDGAARFVVDRNAGFSVHAPGTFETADVVNFALRAVAESDIERKKRKANKPFMMRLLDQSAYTLETPLLRLALQPELVAMAAAYLGLVPVLQFANVFHSSATGAELVKSQLYHCDSDDVEQMKVFVLCETVTPAMGPLTVLRADDSEVVRNRSEYRFNTRLTDEQVEQLLGARPAETPLVGPAGTTAFLDTSRCFHYGSRIEDATLRRIVVLLQYVTPLAFVLPEEDFRDGARFRALDSPNLDPITRLVLGAR